MKTDTRFTLSEQESLSLPEQESLRLSELEMLAEAYLDCRLTRLEEKELSVILASSDYDSPLLSEARSSLEIELGMASDNAEKRHGASFKAVKRRRWLRFCGAAASVALLIGAGFMLLSHGADSREMVLAVVDGRSLSGGQAEAYAMRMQAEDMEMIRMLQAANEKEEDQDMAMLRSMQMEAERNQAETLNMLKDISE